ncbi:Acyl-protein thioesterase 1 [Colletotrichum orbiculare MAFF 240422]|uniref:Acyl-protein thioesterase 1 n=1 Tax=Colletotrichum orbiculare (strain 104-T / ATCC 96160 / CBS 514.97 / LARS 414 / MAFF 240422) TaxID=1213857 RepID=A0A484G3R1_COLOR|nr:Acyl-protein thioesterase 1 [Colletotrichum orbiculare MAFF 240422]
MSNLTHGPSRLSIAEVDKGSFGPSFIIQPISEHTHTAVILHGRGSCGEEFAHELLASTLSDDSTLVGNFPNWRWVFPSSKELWSTAFREHLPAWFEAHSLTDPTARQDLQVDGLCESIDYVSHVVQDEIRRLGGDQKRLVLGGISQGAAVGMWALLCHRDQATGLGGFFATSTWLPFAAGVEQVLAGQQTRQSDGTAAAAAAANTRLDDMILSKMATVAGGLHGSVLQTTPILMGHGVDDAYVDVELGRQAAQILEQGGGRVEWKEYEGAEEEGHWFKVPDGMDDIRDFLERIAQVHRG